MIIQNLDTLLSAPDNFKSLGLEQFSNYVNYIRLSPFCSCGWVEMHADKHHQSPCMWGLYPVYWSDDAVFVHRKNGKLVIQEPTLDVVEFKRTAIHGVLPLHLAQEVVDRQSIRFREYRHWESVVTSKYSLPKLVWSWT